MATGVLPVISKLKPPPAFETSAFGESSSGSSNISAITASPLVVAKKGAAIVALVGQHTNWVNTYSTKTVTSDLGSTFTEIAGSDTVRGPSGQRQGHVILFYCQDPVIGSHTLTGNVTASQALTRLRIMACFYSNIGGYQNLTTQSTTGSAAVNLSIPSVAGNIPFMAMGANGTATGVNWTDRANATNLSDRCGDRGLTAADGNVLFSSSNSLGICVAGVDLIAA